MNKNQRTDSKTSAAPSADLPEHDVFLDARGMICPLPALRARRKLADMKAGQVLLVHATDPDAPQDIFALCHVNGHDYISGKETKDKKKNRLFEILVRRGG